MEILSDNEKIEAYWKARKTEKDHVTHIIKCPKCNYKNKYLTYNPHIYASLSEEELIEQGAWVSHTFKCSKCYFPLNPRFKKINWSKRDKNGNSSR